MGFVLVFVGSGLGGMLRHGAGLLGLVAGLFATSNLGGPELRLFLTTGLLGGFTTFSAFSLDALTLWERGRPLWAAGYVLVSVAVSVAVLALVLLAVRRWG
ncbi:MAG: CrcB family protein [Gemmobacter sp.]